MDYPCAASESLATCSYNFNALSRAIGHAIASSDQPFYAIRVSKSVKNKLILLQFGSFSLLKISIQEAIETSVAIQAETAGLICNNTPPRLSQTFMNHGQAHDLVILIGYGVLTL